MNCLSLNVRGIGDDAKVRWVRSLKVLHKINFLGLQETQLTDYSRIDVHGCWGDTDMYCEGVDSDGRSGGLISIWDTNYFQKTIVLKHRHFIIIIGSWLGIPGHTILANIYAPQAGSEKQKLWEDLIQIKQNWVGNWLLFGDFNAVRQKEERFNSQFCPYIASNFNKFIHDAGVIDFNMSGEQYTYLIRVDAKLSKIDRFLACSSFLSYFPSLTATAHPRHLSDHCPLTLSSISKDFGPPSFKFFNSWLTVDGIDQIVSNAWTGFNRYGRPDVYLAAKLKHVKEEIKKWRKSEHKKETQELTNLKEMTNNGKWATDVSDIKKRNLQILSVEVQGEMEVTS
ncbi:uncharacterized protein LOC111888270 [Lactuca sativa]|uniref:uncharacterized protein LOC111888270 n=1 Tax=Lactuca sativa TaxID=4236 RepID=UPI000CD8DEB3|nr:uncharacterized protein LOC111888270 [Lactuca sativa]